MRFHRWFYLAAFLGYAAIPLIYYGLNLTWQYHRESVDSPIVYSGYPLYGVGLTMTMLGVMSGVGAAVCAGLGVKEWIRERQERKTAAGKYAPGSARKPQTPMKVKPWIGTVLSLVAGIILLTTWASLIGNPFYMHWELLWVGWRPNVVARVCFAVGWAILVHVGALLLCVKPRHRRLAATLILASSALTLLFWADGYLHRNASRDAIFPRWTFLWHLIYPDAPPLFRPFDLLPIASAIGVAGGVLTVLWKPQPNRDSVRSEAWVNHIGVFSAITAFGSLGLTWWVWTFRIFIFPWGTVSFYPPYLWVSRLAAGMYVALVLMLLGGTLGLLGSLVAGKMGRLSLLASGICHVLSTAIFATALQSELEQGGLTVFFIAFYRVGFNLFHWWFEADLLSYLSFGFWTALASGFIALAALLGHPAPSMGTVNPRAKDDDN